jgi:uncharacterized repeat protein (TIGR01451 family)
MMTSSSDLAPTVESKPPQRARARTWVFAVMVVVLVLAAIGYVAWARLRDKPQPGGDGAAIAPGAPAVLFQNMARTGRGRLAVAALADPDSTRRLADLNCDRVHYAGGQGLCLAYGSQFPPKAHATIFGPDLRVTTKLPLDGLPSRARVSPDGRYGATTSFVTGHSYSEGAFSTSTILIDMARGTRIANLEQFTVIRNGRPYTAPDINFWGVTFAQDGNRFYATLSTGGQTYLVHGDIAARHVVVGRENVECPSLSPDGTRLGYKKRVNQGGLSPRWRFHVLDLATGQDTPLAEARSIDDQLEWLDDDTVLYGDPESSNAVMSVPADGTGQPRRFISQAQSPTVLRTSLPDPTVTDLVAGPRIRQANLGVTIAAPPAANPGEPGVYAINVTNHGPRPATLVFVEAQVSGAARIASAEGHLAPGISGYGCTVDPDEARARCDLARVPVDVTWTMTVRLTLTGPGAVEVKALVTGAESDPVNEDDTAIARTTSR